MIGEYIQFGVGQCVANPMTGNLAAAAPGTTAVTQPVRFMTMQDIDLTFDQTMKELKGNYQFPEDVAPADRKLTGKCGTGRVDINLFNQLFFADVFTVGSTALVAAEYGNIGLTPFTVTVAGHATWVTDMGVQFADGRRLKKVTTPSATGEYSVASGVYTFYSVDTGLDVYISYTKTVATGANLLVHNQVLGYGPVFEMWLAESYQANNGVHLWAVRASKLAMPLKRDDYLITTFDFEAFPDANGNVITFWSA